MMAALEYGLAGKVYNLGTNGKTMISIYDLVLKIRALLEMEHKSLDFKLEYDSGDVSRWADATKAKAELNRSYQVGLDEGLKRTVEWYGENLHSL